MKSLPRRAVPPPKRNTNADSSSQSALVFLFGVGSGAALLALVELVLGWIHG